MKSFAFASTLPASFLAEMSGAALAVRQRVGKFVAVNNGVPAVLADCRYFIEYRSLNRSHLL